MILLMRISFFRLPVTCCQDEEISPVVFLLACFSSRCASRGHTRREKCLGAPLRGASASVWVVTQRLRHLRTCPSTLAHLRRNLLVATLRMLRRVQNDPRTHGLRLTRSVSADELLKLFEFFWRQF